MIIKVNVCNVGEPGRAWVETFRDQNPEEPEQWVRDTIERFNATLRPGEKARECLGIEVDLDGGDKQHKWIKTTLAMQSTSGDRYRCENCNVVGSRLIGGKSPVIDSLYGLKKTSPCPMDKDFARRKELQHQRSLEQNRVRRKARRADA